MCQISAYCTLYSSNSNYASFCFLFFADSLLMNIRVHSQEDATQWRRLCFISALSPSLYVYFCLMLFYTVFLFFLFTAQLLSRKDKATFDRLDYLMSKEDNYKRLRDFISSQSMVSCIPYLGNGHKPTLKPCSDCQHKSDFWHIHFISPLILLSLNSRKTHKKTIFTNHIQTSWPGGLKYDSNQISTDASSVQTLWLFRSDVSVFCVTVWIYSPEWSVLTEKTGR